MVAEPGASQIVDVLVPLIMEEIVKAGNAVPRERIAQRICEQIVDVGGSQIAEQDTEAPKTSSGDRTVQRAVEQIPDVPVPEVVTRLLEVPKIIPQDRIQQRTVEQIVDAPVPQVVEELAEVFKVYSRDEVHKRFVEQTIETPSTAIAEMIVEVPVIQTPSVQHVVDTVEVEKPKITELAVQRKRPIQEKINQVTKHVKIPQVQFLTRLMTCPLLHNDRCPRPRQCRKQWRFHCYSSPTRSSITLSWCRDRFPRRLFRRPWRLHSRSVLTR